MTNRKQRESELNEISRSENGRDAIISLYRKHYSPPGTVEPNLSIAEMIQKILDAELKSE